MDDVTSFLGTREYAALKESVAAFSRQNWPDSILPPNNRLADAESFNPVGVRLTRIEREFAQSDLYFGDQPAFSDILARITKFQDRF